MATGARSQSATTLERTSWLTIHHAGQARVSWLVEAILVIVLLAVAWQTLALARNHEAALVSQRALIEQQAATQARLEQVRSALAAPAYVIAYDEQTGQGVQVTTAAPTPARPALAPSTYSVSYDEETGQGVQVTVARP